MQCRERGDRRRGLFAGSNPAPAFLMCTGGNAVSATDIIRPQRDRGVCFSIAMC